MVFSVEIFVIFNCSLASTYGREYPRTLLPYNQKGKRKIPILPHLSNEDMTRLGYYCPTPYCILSLSDLAYCFAIMYIILTEDTIWSGNGDYNTNRTGLYA